VSKKRVYVCGPISFGDLAHNIAQAEAAFFALLKAGFAPFCPHWSCYSNGPIKLPTTGAVIAEATSMGGGGCTHEQWVDVDLAWVEVADAVLRLPGESKGADREVNCAMSKNIIVVFVDPARGIQHGVDRLVVLRNTLADDE
jgi:hypothetical protein